MSGNTSIQWTDASWSPVVGCTRVSAGCDHCYAAKMTRRLEAMGQEKYKGLSGRGHFNGVARLHAPSLDWPLRWRGAKTAKAEGRPSRIFVNPMSDLFHERLSDEAIAAVFGVMAACPQHTFQVLTKRPERARKWFEWAAAHRLGPSGAVHSEAFEAMLKETPSAHRVWESGSKPWPLPNVWLGVSVEDQATADERIPLLLQCPAAVRFVSYEPALGAVDFARWLRPSPVVDLACHPAFALSYTPDLNWLIVGGESGPGARPFDLAWARAVVGQCKAAGVACFVKQLGARPFAIGTHTKDGLRDLRDRKGGDASEWPEDLRVREFPA